MDLAFQLPVAAGDPSVEELCRNYAMINIPARHLGPSGWGCLRHGRNYDYKVLHAVDDLRVAQDCLQSIRGNGC